MALGVLRELTACNWYSGHGDRPFSRVLVIESTPSIVSAGGRVSSLHKCDQPRLLWLTWAFHFPALPHGSAICRPALIFTVSHLFSHGLGGGTALYAGRLMTLKTENQAREGGGRRHVSHESSLCAPVSISSVFVFLTIWAERELLISMVLITESRTSSGSSGSSQCQCFSWH